MRRVTRYCPICSAFNAEHFFENTLAVIGGYDMSYTIGRCRSCGFFFAETLADQETIKSYYQSVSKYDVAGEISGLDLLRIDAAVSICQGQVPYDAMVIDLGCGYGALLSRLKSAGWIDLYGIDPAPNSAMLAHDLFGLDNIFCGTTAEAHNVLPLENADLVCMTAVLEHLPDLRADISNLLEKIRPGCRLLVEVPALECFSGKKSEPFGEFSLEHLQFFSSTSLINFFSSLGAKPLAMEIVDLPVVASGSLFGLFEFTGDVPASFETIPESSEVMENYISESKHRLGQALSRIPEKPLLIYGAGSHTARLLPHLEKMHGREVAAVVDRNHNLVNKSIGKWVIQAPSEIASFPDTHILVSSFRSQNEIAKSLQDRFPNPVVLLYS
jgi:SAM-dependent methyltransferase